MGLIPHEFKEMLDPTNIAKIKDALREFALEVDAINENTLEIIKKIDDLNDRLDKISTLRSTERKDTEKDNAPDL